VLYTHLLAEWPDRVAELHRRASHWHDRQGEPITAVRHSLAAGDVERAAELVELAMPALRRDRREATVHTWIDAIPDEVVRDRPVLEVAFAGALIVTGQVAGVEERLASAERRMHAERPIVADEAAFAALPGSIALYRAACGLTQGDVPTALAQAQLAIERAGDDHLTHAAAAGLRGLVFWAAGDLDLAHTSYRVCMGGLRKAGHIPDILGCSIAVADIQITQGRLTDAVDTYSDALELAAADPVTVRGTADMYVGLSQIACERNDLDAAAAYLSQSRLLGEGSGLPQNPYRWRVAMARLREAQGDLDSALRLLDEAQRVYVGDFSPDVRPIQVLRVRLLATHGRQAEALTAVRELGVSIDDDLSYLREFAHITLAGVLLTSGRRRNALELLERLRVAAQLGGRNGNLIEILVLQALAHEDPAAALVTLEQALALAEPHGYVRTFADAGAPMTALLTAFAREHGSSGYVSHVLSACGVEPTAATLPASAPRGPAPPEATPRSGAQRLVDPLSGRELDVLRLLATDLDGPDIARRLSVSLNTLRTHTKNIYAKLGVNNRRAAVRQAGQFDLL
jgi:LuxR family maltose regulon positive regulatory protein